MINDGNLLQESQGFVMCARFYIYKFFKLVLQKNFYVDDLLKSLKDVESAKELLKDIMNMCKAVGFQLTKFISSSKGLLLSIP